MSRNEIDSNNELVERIRNSPFFDEEFYLKKNINVRDAGVDPALHFLLHGGIDGTDPGPLFSTNAYLRFNPDVADNGINALLHYELYGRYEGRTIASCDEFSTLFQSDKLLFKTPALSRQGVSEHACSSTKDFNDPMNLQGPKGNKNYRVIIYGNLERDFVSALEPQAAVWEEIKHVEEVVLIPDIPNAIIPAATKNDLISVIIPITVDGSKNFSRAFYSLAPDPGCIDVLADKGRFAEYIQAQGLNDAYPRLYETPEKAEFPCVLKRVDIDGGKGVVLAESREHLRSLLQQPFWLGKDVLIQAYIEGNIEYVTHAVCVNGRIIWHCTFRYGMLGKNPVRGTAKFFVDPIDTADIALHNIVDITRRLNYNGPLNIDYKLSGRCISIFEFNPRLGWSLMLPKNVGYLRGALCAIIHAAHL
jgi:hypothetical protein